MNFGFRPINLRTALRFSIYALLLHERAILFM